MRKTNIEMIRGHMDEPELLAQLAEELTEAAKAALKLRRAKTGVNPTPVTEDEAFHNLLEEIADVSVCLEVMKLDTPMTRMKIASIMAEKEKRWARRLDGRDGEERDPYARAVEDQAPCAQSADTGKQKAGENRETSSWYARYPNDNGEYEITFQSRQRDRAKAVEKVCCAIMSKTVKGPDDIARVRTGKWVEKTDTNTDTYYDCSACGESFFLLDGDPDENFYRYCPCCGARMDGVEHGV